MKILNKQVEELLKLKPYQRYQHSIKIIADTEAMYSLLNETGKWELSEVEGRITFFLWPNEEYAKPFLKGSWANATIEKITLEEYFSDIQIFLLEQGFLLNVFPQNNLSGFIVTLEEFDRDMGAELLKYE